MVPGTTDPACPHVARTQDGVCTVCGDCAHDVVLNGACFVCGTTDLPGRERLQAPASVIPGEALVRKVKPG